MRKKDGMTTLAIPYGSKKHPMALTIVKLRVLTASLRSDPLIYGVIS